MWYKLNWMILVVAVVLATGTAQATSLFSEDFENGLNQWTGKNYGSYQAVIVPDPLRPGNHVVSFSGTTNGGDIFSVPATTLTEGQQYSFSLEYLGRAVYNSIPDNYGGFASISDVVVPDNFYLTWPWIFGTQADYPLLQVHLIDDGQWRSYSYDFVWHKSDFNTQYDNIHVMLEDFSSSGNTVGDVFFDNVQINAVPEPSTLVLLGMGAFSLLAFAWRRRKRIG